MKLVYLFVFAAGCMGALRALRYIEADLKREHDRRRR